MAHVSPNVMDMEAKSFVGRLLLRERFTWIHQYPRCRDRYLLSGDWRRVDSAQAGQNRDQVTRVCGRYRPGQDSRNLSTMPKDGDEQNISHQQGACPAGGQILSKASKVRVWGMAKRLIAPHPGRRGRPLRSHFLMSSWLVVTVGSDLAVRSCGNANAARAIPH